MDLMCGTKQVGTVVNKYNDSVRVLKIYTHDLNVDTTSIHVLAYLSVLIFEVERAIFS